MNYFPAEGNHAAGHVRPIWAPSCPASRPTSCPASPSRGAAGRHRQRPVRFRNGGCAGDLPSDLHPVRRYGALHARRAQHEIRLPVHPLPQRLRSSVVGTTARPDRSVQRNLYRQRGNRLCRSACPPTWDMAPGIRRTVGQRNSAVGAYFQDDWKISSETDRELRHSAGSFSRRFMKSATAMTNFSEYTGQDRTGRRERRQPRHVQPVQRHRQLPAAPRRGLEPHSANTVDSRRVQPLQLPGRHRRIQPPGYQRSVERRSGRATVDGANGIPANQVTLDQGFAGLGSPARSCTRCRT